MKTPKEKTMKTPKEKTMKTPKEKTMKTMKEKTMKTMNPTMRLANCLFKVFLVLLVGLVGGGCVATKATSGTNPAAARAFAQQEADLQKPVSAGSALGDSGHFLSQFMPDIRLNNPTGRAFTVTVRRYRWPVSGFNAGLALAVHAPDGTVVAEAALSADQPTLQVPAGTPGVYRLSARLGGYSLFWVESDLKQMVAWAGDIGTTVENQPDYKVLMLHAIAPRRWYFYVPPGTRSFAVQTVIGTYQTQREDFGLMVMNPRGQRVAALYGGLSPSKPRLQSACEIVSTTIEPDAGTTGRFWSIWVTGGDSHCYSDLRIVLQGVPPYLAPAPEQWFDPATGAAPTPLVYDEAPIRYVDPDAALDPVNGRRLSTDFYKWSPAPYLGDEDYNGIRGAATVFLLNPENRPIDFGAGSYLPPPEGQPVRYTVFGPGGKVVTEKTATFLHQTDYRVSIPAAGPGVYRVNVDSPTWYAWTEPAVPMVLAGLPAAKGGHRFPLQLNIARHWFFRVPKGTTTFSIVAAVADPNHVLSLEVHAPDRLIEPVYVRGGHPRTVTVEVPPGADDRVWFLRTEVGSPTRFLVAEGDPAQHTRIDVDITLRGVPGYLAPTWEQWFDPEHTDSGGEATP